jgi:two-component system NtrC family sensor kinase
MTKMRGQRQADPGTSEPVSPSLRRDYRRLWVILVVAICVVCIAPLLIMTLLNYRQYQGAIQEERVRPILRLTHNSANSLHFFLSERQSALQFVVQEFPLETLLAAGELDRLLASLKIAFGGFNDLEIIDPAGEQQVYSGPYELQGQSYGDQDWFHEVLSRGGYTSRVFMGHRNLPHFVIAISSDEDGDDPGFVLRATIDCKSLDAQIPGMGMGSGEEAFIVDRAGTLQTPSRRYGPVLGRLPWKVPPCAPGVATAERVGPDGEQLLVGYAYIEHSPFVLILISRRVEAEHRWISLRRNLLLFLAASVLAIVAVVVWGVTGMVRRFREGDRRRAGLLHQVEYTNKMAAIGRLAAGVAHEVNNPLAIISEKAGLMEDILTDDLSATSEEHSDREEILRQLGSIQNSVDRCAGITHRLLGFAKHMDVRQESLSLPELIREVFGFLERESRHRDIQVEFHADENLPRVTSDKGQLQQVFLNLLNNAIAAVDDGGHIDVRIVTDEPDGVVISVTDDGKGIPEGDLDHIFEPFFSTKGGEGSGLGLSITHGIISKLGGRVSVSSQAGVGTTFSIALPKEPRSDEAQGEAR